ncbi:MAG: SEL1-like repeat protein [Pseudomonadota bacterium]
MSAQTYQFGEGVEEDETRAIALYEEACALASTPEFPSCAFARRRIERLRAE